ncbi:MAG TPA: hypothetical protein VF355_07065 [Anaerolineaceae bacterium]
MSNDLTPTEAPHSPRPRKSSPRQSEKTSRVDEISGTIGSNNQGAIIGKNIFQNIIIIGKVKIPVLPILVLIGLVIAAAVFFGLRLLGPDHMTGSFNLAVAEFGQLDANGRVVSSPNGPLISQRLYEGLKIELDSLSPADRANFQPQVWQDSLDITQKRVKIGIIPGDTPQARLAAACSLGQKINANVVIYGNLPPDLSSGTFIPEFAVCDNVDLRVDADEIVGAHQLIQGIPVQLLSQLGRPGTDLAVNIKINSWSGTVSLFSIGIMYDLQGRSDLALGVFQQAREQLKSGAGSAGEVLWFFIGREELTLASPTAARDGVDHLANAQAAFEEALKINPSYARAHIGLGGVFFSRAQLLQPVDRLKSADLAGAFQEYQSALNSAPDSAGALIDTKAHLGLAATWILEGAAQQESNQPAKASDSYDRAIQSASAAVQPLTEAKQYRALALVYLTLGEAYQEQGNLKLQQVDKDASRTFLKKASDSYNLCIQQKDAAFTDQTLADNIVVPLCIPYKKDTDASLAALN